MKAAQQLPTNYPNVYFHDHHNHKYPTITFIRFAVTPTGRVGKDFEQFRIYIKPESKFVSMSLEQLTEYAELNMSLHKLRKGYAWGSLFIQHNFLH